MTTRAMQPMDTTRMELTSEWDKGAVSWFLKVSFKKGRTQTIRDMLGWLRSHDNGFDVCTWSQLLANSFWKRLLWKGRGEGGGGKRSSALVQSILMTCESVGTHALSLMVLFRGTRPSGICRDGCALMKTGATSAKRAWRGRGGDCRL